MVSAKGYGTESEPIDTDQVDGPVIVKLKRERVLHLAVVDEKEKPIAGVLVELMVPEINDQRTETTGSDGRFIFRGLSQDAERLQVRLSHDDYVKTGRFDRRL